MKVSQEEWNDALAIMAMAQDEARHEKQAELARNHKELYEEVSAKFKGLSDATAEYHRWCGQGRSGPPPPWALSEDQVEARKRAILSRAGFKV